MASSEVAGADPRQRAVFVDTKVFLRFVTNDVAEQAARAEALFRDAASGKIELTTNAMVVAELVWVLESYYRLSREQVRELATAVPLMDGLYLPQGDAVIDALTLYGTSDVDFIDAYNLCWMKRHGVARFATFDKKHYSGTDGISIHPF